MWLVRALLEGVVKDKDVVRAHSQDDEDGENLNVTQVRDAEKDAVDEYGHQESRVVYFVYSVSFIHSFIAFIHSFIAFIHSLHSFIRCIHSSNLRLHRGIAQTSSGFSRGHAVVFRDEQNIRVKKACHMYTRARCVCVTSEWGRQTAPAGNDIKISNIPSDATNSDPVWKDMYTHTARMDANAQARS